MREVARGGLVLDSTVVASLFETRPADGRLERLTPRERPVLECMATGASNHKIAHDLGVTERIVERHVSAVFTKLELASGPDAHRRVLAVLAYLGAS